MKPHRRPLPGYTLMELMVGITIVILLAGIVIAVMPGAIRQSKRQETRALLTRIEAGLEKFHDQQGYYPRHPETPTEGERAYPDAVAREGASVLYRLLSGDHDLDGETDIGVDPLVENLPSALMEGGGRMVVDPFGAPIRYLSGAGSETRRTRNPDFDLWSLGGTRNQENPASWLTR